MKIYSVDHKAHRERFVAAEVIIFIPNMNPINLHLDTIKDLEDESETLGLVELLFVFLGLFLLLLELLRLAFLLAGPVLSLLLPQSFACSLLQCIHGGLLTFLVSVLGLHQLVHHHDICQGVIRAVARVGIPIVVLNRRGQARCDLYLHRPSKCD